MSVAIAVCDGSPQFFFFFLEPIAVFFFSNVFWKKQRQQRILDRYNPSAIVVVEAEVLCKESGKIREFRGESYASLVNGDYSSDNYSIAPFFLVVRIHESNNIVKKRIEVSKDMFDNTQKGDDIECHYLREEGVGSAICLNDRKSRSSSDKQELYIWGFLTALVVCISCLATKCIIHGPAIILGLTGLVFGITLLYSHRYIGVESEFFQHWKEEKNDQFV